MWEKKNYKNVSQKELKTEQYKYTQLKTKTKKGNTVFKHALQARVV